MSDNSQGKPKLNEYYPEADKLRRKIYNEFLADKFTIKEVKENKNNIINNTLDVIKSVLESTKANNIVPISHYDINKQMEIARNFLRIIIDNLTSQTVAKFRDSYLLLLDENPFDVGPNASYKKGILPKIANFILLNSINDGIEPKIQETVGNMLEGKKNTINNYISLRNNEKLKELEHQRAEEKKQIEEERAKLQNQIDELMESKDLTEKEKEEKINILNEQIKQKDAEKKKLEKGIKISKNQIDTVVGGVEDILKNTKYQNAALGKLLDRNRSRELDERANKFIGDKQPIKSRIDSIREQLAKEGFDQKQINQIIAKALSKEEHYKRVVAANPDLFDRDMSPDTVQNENEQFQSKLRQQNLRYILPAFIERRDKLVENTLNPNLLKGAFAI